MTFALRNGLIGLWITATLLVVSGVIAACGGGQPEPTQPPATADAAERQPGDPEARVIDLTLAFVPPRFQPGPINVKVGEPIQFAAKSISGRHQLVIEELGIDMLVPQPSLNETAVSEVVIPQNVGEFLVICSIHTRIDMETTLVVTE